MSCLFYTVEDLQILTGKSYVYCCNLIKSINNELEQEGKITFKGQILKEEFNRRIGVSNEA